MEHERRKNKRRTPDRILVETVAILQVLEKISRDEINDHTEYYTDLAALIDRVGRRQTDQKMGKLLFSSLQAIAGNINRLLEKERSLRKVKIIRLSGKPTHPMSLDSTIEGWEADRPRVGESYRIYKDDGGVFSSSPVTEVCNGHVRTRNSLYRIENLQN